MAKEETIQVQGKVTPHHEGMKDEGGGMKADGLIHPSSLIPHPPSLCRITYRGPLRVPQEGQTCS
jgi:hypothetical protein